MVLLFTISCVPCKRTMVVRPDEILSKVCPDCCSESITREIFDDEMKQVGVVTLK
jgi:hypothetical protein